MIMRTNKIKLVIEATIRIPVQEDEDMEVLFEEVVEELEEGKLSAWTQEAVIESLDWDDGISIVQVDRAEDNELAPEEELNFDY